MDFQEIRQHLNNNVEDVCRVLLPTGRRKGKAWLVGNIEGDKGDSLDVCLQGKNLGVWKDWAAPGKGGDLINLWQTVRGFKTPREAIQDIHDYYGIKDPEHIKLGSKKVYEKPEKPQTKKSEKVFKYLTETRKLAVETIQAFKVESNDHYYYMPSYRNGELIRFKNISIHRDAKGKKEMFASPGAEPCLFGWQAIDPNAIDVVITEGEIDAMTLHQWGYPALSIPNGVNSLDWIEYEYENLSYFEHIYICMDGDYAGQRAIQELVNRLGRHRCSSITLPKKDANECLVAGLGPKVVSDAINNRKEYNPDKLQSFEFYMDLAHAYFEGTAESKGQALPFGDSSGLRFIPGEMTVWQGYNGHGKSMVLNQVIIDLAVNKDQVVCLASMEMKIDMLMGRFMKQITGMPNMSRNYRNHIGEVLTDKVFIYNHLGQEKIDEILDTFAYCRKKYGASHFVIDSLMKCGLKKDDYDAQKTLMEKCTTFIHAYNCHLHLVAHTKKPDRGTGELSMPGKYDVEGASEITNFTDNLIAVLRNKKKEKSVEDAKTDAELENLKTMCDATISIQKNRNGQFEKEISVWYDPSCQQYLDYPGQTPKRYINYSEVI